MSGKKKLKDVSYAKWGYIFCIPFVAAFLTFMLYPLIYTVIIGFTDLSGIGAREWNILDDPFENFKVLFGNQLFRTSIINTVKIWVINFIPQITLALLLTSWFTRRRNKFNGQGAFKVLFYMPNIITAASIALLFNVLFMFPTGAINYILTSLGLVDEPIFFIRSTTASPLIVAFIQFWMWYGYTMLILISGVLGLNPDMYEAADIDGANGVQQFFRITLPNLKTILLFTLVTSTVGGLNMFDIPRMFNNGEPDGSTMTVALFIYNLAFGPRNMYNYAAAASMLLFVIIAVLAGLLFYALRDRDAIREKKYLKAQRRALKQTGGA